MASNGSMNIASGVYAKAASAKKANIIHSRLRVSTKGGDFDTYVERKADELLDTANKMGVIAEADELVESLNACRSKIMRKVTELSALEAIAMESTDENIVELRQELFTVVKLVHNDLLDDVMKDYDEEHLRKSEAVDSGDQCEQPLSNSEISRWDVLERMRVYLNKRAKYKEFMKRNY